MKTKAQIEQEIADVVSRLLNLSDQAVAVGFTKFRKREHGLPRASMKTAHGEYAMLARPSDFLVDYWPVISATGPLRIKPSERIGIFPSITQAMTAVDVHQTAQDLGIEVPGMMKGRRGR